MRDPCRDGEDDTAYGMTDLEERLRGDDGEETRAALMSRLTQLDVALGAMVGRGLRPDDYGRATDMRSSLVAARAILAGGR